MKNQYKSANPADLSCHGENCTAGAWPNSDDHSVECVKESAISQGWDVPPAGDVEVLGYLIETHSTLHYSSKFIGGHGNTCTELVDRAHVIRLTAEVDRWHDLCVERTTERDGLLANVKELTEHRDELKMQRDRWVRMHNNLQSELTKARECLKDLGVDWPQVSDLYQPATPIAHNVDESCGQDAEAAKGEADVD